MKAVMVMFDSLNRNMLEPYGCDWVHAPNFSRLADRAVTFTNAFVGSMPCMPARRELHTGRYNFLHRSWGPLEPFDDSMPELLKRSGAYTHLISDHYHYWEDGGATYHTRYNSWEISRGQEGDPWKANLTDDIKMISQGNLHSESVIRQDCVNRHYMQKVEDQPQSKTFAMAQEFLHTNHGEDNWFLHIETFDPHEPYFVDGIYRKHYSDISPEIERDWVGYGKFEETSEAAKHFQALNAALISMCDENLGKILDIFDQYDLWKDTLLIVNTDHGFLLGERQCWGKCLVPFYNEVAKIPLFIYNPRQQAMAAKCDKLVQTIDIAPTLLDYFGVDIPDDVQGGSLLKTLACDEPVRQAALFGVHGGHINVTDGRYVYMRAAQNEDNSPLYEYTLMPTNMKHFFKPEKLKDAVMHEPFGFTKGIPVMQIPGDNKKPQANKWGTMLFDLEKDPHQLNPINDQAIEMRMCELLKKLMKQNEAPKSQYERVGLSVDE
jgi:arylsulfatase A-like enzyme